MIKTIIVEKPELNACCIVKYVKCDLAGQMWSKRPAFAITQDN